MVGEVWFGGIIGGIVLGGIGVLLSIISSTRSFGGGCQILSSVGGLVGVVAYVALATDDGECYSDGFEPAASMYAVIIGMICYLIGGIGSCGSGASKNE